MLACCPFRTLESLRRGALSGAALAAMTISAVPPAVAQDEEKKTDIPIKRVVMFSSGVAFFEHDGEVEGNATGRSEVQRQGHQRPAQEHGPAGRRRRADFDRQLRQQGPDHADARDVLDRPDQQPDAGRPAARRFAASRSRSMRRPRSPARSSASRQRQVPAGKDGRRSTVAFLNLLTDEGLRSVSLDDVGRIKLANAKLDAELRQALLVLASGKSQDKKAVSLSFLGEGKRPVRVGYIQEAPIWKTSYRLVLGDDEAAVPARLGDCREHDRVRLERREPDARQRPADLVRHGPLSAAVSRPARCEAGAVRLAAAADVRPGPGGARRPSSAGCRRMPVARRRRVWPSNRRRCARGGAVPRLRRRRRPRPAGRARLRLSGRAKPRPTKRPERLQPAARRAIGRPGQRRRRDVPLHDRHAREARPRQVGHAADRQ